MKSFRTNQQRKQQNELCNKRKELSEDKAGSISELSGFVSYRQTSKTLEDMQIQLYNNTA
jgi:hypothetical protein